MAVTKINGNQISNTTSAIISTLSFLNTTSVLQLPTGTTAQRPTGVTYGTIRFNTTLDNPEVFKSNSDGQGTDGWSLIGAGGPHVGSKDTSYIRTNSGSIDENITIGPTANGGAQFTNAGVFGPTEIANGFTFTIETGATFTVIGDDPDNFVYSNVTITDKLDVTSGRLDLSATREVLQSQWYDVSDSMIMLDYNYASIKYLTNISNNFNINILNLPTSSINLGQINTNQAYSFTLLYFNGSNRYRPTGTIYLDGNSIGNAIWQSGVPATLNSNKHIVIGLSILRIVEYTNAVGGNTVYWRSYLTFNEHS